MIALVIGFIGQVGSGKSLSLVYEAYKYYLRGHTVYSNIKLNFPFIPLTFGRLQQMIENKEQLQDAVLLIDECHVFIDSRNSMKKRNKIVSYFILQTRKRNVRLLYTTQHLAQVEKRLRDTTDIIVFNKNLSNQTSLVSSGEYKPTYIRQEFLFQWSDNPKPKTRVIYGDPVFSLYDTREIIDMEDDED